MSKMELLSRYPLFLAICPFFITRLSDPDFPEIPLLSLPIFLPRLLFKFGIPINQCTAHKLV